jgi:hypothetical protein
MFLAYDAGKGLNNQEIKTVDMVLEFKPEHMTRYKELISSVTRMQGKDQVLCFVHLCAFEIKFLHGCNEPWDKLRQQMHEGQSASAYDGSD